MAGQIRVRASLRLVKEDKLFGPGAAQLLAGVDELGSLRRSAARMEMSYNKAWSVIHGCEEQLGFALLERRIGGAGGGGAVLTEKGRDCSAATARLIKRRMRCLTGWRGNISQDFWSEKREERR